MKSNRIISLFFFSVLLLPASGLSAAPPDGLLGILGDELKLSMDKLAAPDGAKPYYISYAVADEQVTRISATLGTLLSDDNRHSRLLDVDVRVGDYQLDSSHKIRGEGFIPEPSSGAISLDDDPDAIRHALWLATDARFKAAVKQFEHVRTNLKTKVEEEDKSGDFTREKPAEYAEPAATIALDRGAWAERLRKVSRLAYEYPLVYQSSVTITATADNRYFVTSEGTKIQQGHKYIRVVLTVGTKAEDGMELDKTFIFDACHEDKLPSEEQMTNAMKNIIKQVLALREAPLVEPCIVPAILMNRASGVFFHEIFGHRIEGHRQKDVEEGQTFAKKVGEAVLPDFITVRDDPTRDEFNGQDLRGFYHFDDQGVPTSNVMLVDHGVLKSFLMSRSPLNNFPQSNGHGRRQPGLSPVSRQGNLTVESSKTISFEKLKQMLVEECKRQDKPYGLIFEDITGGFTGTQRQGAQSFKVLPVVVYRVYADGKPDELVRGVDIVGTPLTCFSKIIGTADDPAVFNGTCGAESGSVPVSAISPSILVSQIEVEKRVRAQDKPPILKPPIADQEKAKEPAKETAKDKGAAEGETPKPAAKEDAAKTPAPAAGIEEKLPESDTLMKAIVDELGRTLTLHMEDLEKPYFAQFDVDDSLNYQISAEYGALTSSERSRSRRFRCQVRVGSYELDNTNFSEGGFRSFMGLGLGGGTATLPLEDNYAVLRQAMWEAADSDYKEAVETLTRKRAYLKDKNIADRPNDFSKAKPAEHSGPPAVLRFDRAQWEKNLKQLSASFKKIEPIQRSSVRLIAGASNSYVATSEGTRLRVPDTRAVLLVTAEAQGADGMRLSTSRTFTAESAADLPSMEQLQKGIDEMATELTAALKGPMLDRYAGPVLFDDQSSPQLFQAVLANELAARPEPIGEGRRGPREREGLESRLGSLILPKAFQIWDDPTAQKSDGQSLLGYYEYDDEGVPAQRVDLVKNGKIEAMCLSRAPVKKLSGSNGHGRRRGGAVRASVSNLFIQNAEGVPQDEMKKKLIEAAKDAGLEYGVRIKLISSASGREGGGPPMRGMRRRRGPGGGAGGGGESESASIGSPVVAYKVFVSDGHEEPFRGCEFGDIQLKELKRILAAGDKPTVYNSFRAGLMGMLPPVAVVAPPVLFEELELTKAEEELDKPPILKAPAFR